MIISINYFKNMIFSCLFRLKNQTFQLLWSRIGDSFGTYHDVWTWNSHCFLCWIRVSRFLCRKALSYWLLNWFLSILLDSYFWKNLRPRWKETLQLTRRTPRGASDHGPWQYTQGWTIFEWCRSERPGRLSIDQTPIKNTAHLILTMTAYLVWRCD